ncbi:hypothetical protein SAY86_025606 [Trapa natans]|uniref:Uncharacterized protein n=1 Tax=Trapa natans TaxID=22666 RepID=A0AAN7MSK6_TRANT|nr:hypothetical protein SAY86_025606 [Trapa natans]
MDGHHQQHGYGFFRLSSPRRSLVSSSTALEGSYGAMDSTAADHQSQYKLSNPNLERQSSSPSSGLFSQLSPQNGFAASRWKGQSTFPPSMSSVLGGNGQDDSSRLSIGIGGSRFSGSGLHFNSWTDPSHFSDSQQTNTADMLNLAVDYIKDLQHQYKTLNDNLSNCKCSSTRDSTTNQLM